MSDRAYDIALDYEVEGAGSPILIASVYSDEGETVAHSPTYISPEEAEANARLIAAAPDLLAGAKAFLAAFTGPASIDAVMALREAVAKAEGRSRG